MSQKAILAYILKSTMEEFQDVSVKQIAEELIWGTPEVGTIAVHQDTPDAPKAANGSDASNAPDGYGDPPRAVPIWQTLLRPGRNKTNRNG